MSIALDLFCFAVPLRTLSAAELSVATGVGRPFRLPWGCKDISHDAAFYVDGAVKGRHIRDWLVGFGVEEEISSISAAAFGFGQI
eukprot:scaffold29546_cov26-Attheya_sp.AAC.1